MGTRLKPSGNLTARDRIAIKKGGRAQLRQKKAPEIFRPQGLFPFRSLAVTYSGMACGHTTIGAERFHFRVRNGIGWFPLAIAARQNRFNSLLSTLVAFAK